MDNGTKPQGSRNGHTHQRINATISQGIGHANARDHRNDGARNQGSWKKQKMEINWTSIQTKPFQT